MPRISSRELPPFFAAFFSALSPFFLSALPFLAVGVVLPLVPFSPSGLPSASLSAAGVVLVAAPFPGTTAVLAVPGLTAVGLGPGPGLAAGLPLAGALAPLSSPGGA